MTTADRIARLKIALDDVKPKVVRRVEVPFAIRLDDLHIAIQIAMGWWNTHLYEFRVGDIRWGVPMDDGSDFWEVPRDAAKSTLKALVAETGTKSIRYWYDFGDDWIHRIRIEAIAGAELWNAYPRLLAARGRCPPEDVGGPWGYAEYLKAIADPYHKRHAETIAWRGPGFDPEVVDVAMIEKELAKLAKHWSPRKSKTSRKLK